MAKVGRDILKTYFRKNSIPTEANFVDLIDSALNDTDDGFQKAGDSPLRITANGAGKLLQFLKTSVSTPVDFSVDLQPSGNPGLKLFPGESWDGKKSIFLDGNDGSVAIGTDTTAGQKLNVEGNTKLNGDVTVGSKLMVGQSVSAKQLDIQGTTRTGNTHLAAIKGLYVTADSSDAAGGVEFRHTNGTQGIGFGFNSIYATGSNANQNLNLMPRGSGGVGIGTISPNALLEIRKDASTSLGPVLLLNNSGGGSGSGGAIDFNGYGRNSGVSPTLRLQSLDDGNFSSHFVISTLSGATSATSGSLSERMRIASNGNVGIGTASPTKKLQVEGDSLFKGNLNIEGGSSSNLTVSGNSTLTGNVGIGTASPSTKLHVIGDIRLDGGKIQSNGPLVLHPDVDNTGDDIVRFLNSIGDENMRIHSDGNVGIGTASPTKKLQVEGDSLFKGNLNIEGGSSNNLTVSGNSTLTGNVGIGTASPTKKLHVEGDSLFKGNLNIQGGSSNNLTVAGNSTLTGNVGIGTASPAEKLHVIGNLRVDEGEIQSWGQLIFHPDVDKSGDDIVRFVNSDGGETMRIHSDGNVGIGTASPGSKLSVNGNLEVTGVYTQSANDGNVFKMYVGSNTGGVNHGTGMVFELARGYQGTNRRILWDGDNNWDQLSDGMFKTNIVKEEGILDRMMHLKVVNYNWKDKADAKRKPVGFIAQEVRPWFPTLVNEYSDPETKE
ncbi:MAG: hypothetical protein RLZZ165_1332, partial [Bacteroidota bacterium]